MAGHALRGMATAGLALIVVETIATTGGGRVASFFTDVKNLVDHALSPDVPLIPDRRPGAAKAANPAPGFYNMTPDQLNNAVQGFVKASEIQQATTDPNNIIGRLNTMPTISPTTAQVDWAAVARSLPH